jgi:tetratricopeptide (TPR) repeat protein
MSDIFISYATEDRPRLQPLVRAFEQHGWSVWWDRQILPGKTFDEVIEEALSAARCVVVLWSETSVRSEWVKTEAAEAAQRNILVPILIDVVKIPLEFRRIQAARLIGWQGEQTHPEFLQLLQAITRLLAQAPAESAPKEFETPQEMASPRQEVHTDKPRSSLTTERDDQPPTSPLKTKRRASWLRFAAGGVGVALALLAWESSSIFIRQTKQSSPEPLLRQEEQLTSTETSRSEEKVKDGSRQEPPMEKPAQPEALAPQAEQIAAPQQQSGDEVSPPQVQTPQLSQPQPPAAERTPAENEQKEKALLAKAEKQVTRGKLTTPPGDNALETYQLLLRLTPQHEQALAGIRAIQQRYQEQAEAAAKAGKWTTARAQYEKALAIDPHDPTVLAALQQVKTEEQAATARAEQARQQQEEARKALARQSPSPQEQSTTRTESQKPPRTVDLLLAEKKPVQIPNPTEQAAALLHAAEQGDIDTAKQLLASRAPVNATDQKGKTPLMYAAAAGNTALVELLLTKGADVNKKNAGGGTALMYAAWHGYGAIVQALLTKGANIDAQDNDGWSALMDAARNGHGDVVRLLLAKGAQINLKSTDGETALGEAKAKNYTDVVALLTQAGAR